MLVQTLMVGALFALILEPILGSRLPQLPLLVLMQVFRGLILTGIVVALVRTLSLTGASAPIAVGCLLALLGGVAPLLNPNPYMPSEVRFAHMVEVGSSYFAFGLLAAFILRARTGRPDV